MSDIAQKCIIGTGLIAKSLTGVSFNQNTLVLASGVSNSQEVRQSEFQREAELIQREMANHPGFHVIYCSTCSIDSGASTPYIVHKQAMEQKVRASAASFHVFRLPQVVGLVQNSTLVSFFVDAILHGRVLNVQAQATRNLLDVSDFARITKVLVDQGLGVNSTLNMASGCSVPVVQIVEEIASLLQRQPQIVVSPSGYSQDIDIDFLKSVLGAQDAIFAPDYWRQVLRHYVPMYARNHVSFAPSAS